MYRRLSLFGSCLLLAMTAACTQAPPDTHDADVAAMKANEAAMVKACAAKDAAQFASNYAADAQLLLPNSPAIAGPDAIQKAFKGVTEDPNFALTFEASRVEVAKSGDLGYSQGTYSMTMTDPKEKKPVTDKGKYVTAWKKQVDGTWKIVADMNNSDLPLPAPGK